MTTLYRPGKEWERSAWRPRAIIWFLIVLVFLLFAGNAIASYLSGSAIALGRPFWYVRSLFADQDSLQAKNKQLQQDLDSLRAQVLDRNVLVVDNEGLRVRLGRLEMASSTRVVARVLIGWRTNAFDNLALDLGRTNSELPLKAGDLVLSGGDVWIGELAEVDGKTSKARLLSQAGLETPAVLGRARVPVTLTGRGGGNFVATVPAGAAIAAKDLALVSGPTQDWVVAVVGAVESKMAGGDQLVYLRAPVSAAELKYVELEPR